MSRVEENKEVMEAYKLSCEKINPFTSLDQINSVTFSIMEAALLDISKSLAVIADAMSKGEKEETDDPNSTI